MDVELFITPSLGDNSYLLASGGEAAFIDPQRDAWRFLAAAESRKVVVRYVLETHVHNDYISGALEVRASTGAEIAAPARGNYEFPHRRMEEGQEVRVGALRLVAMDTPGHTPEHIAWLVYEENNNDPVAVFTGGSLLVGSAGRTDLLGQERTEELARAQYRTLRRLTALPDLVSVLPTHGAGSFCASTAPARSRTTKVGSERTYNTALIAPDEEAFIRQQSTGLLSYPTYYRYIGPINRIGPEVLRSLPKPKALSADEVAQRMRGGAWVVDARDRMSFAKAHLPGSVNIELDSSFGTYVGWVIPFNSPLVLVPPVPVNRSVEEAVTQLIRIGYERIEGYMEGRVEDWRSDGRPTSSYPTADVADLCEVFLNDQQVQIPDSLHVFIGDLSERISNIPKDKEVWVVCASGYRASIAASLLDRAWFQARLVGRGGVPEWLARCYPGEATSGKR